MVVLLAACGFSSLACAQDVFGKGGPSDTVSQLIEFAAANMEAGNFDEAFRDYQTVLNLDPENVEAIYQIGVIHWRRQQFPTALEHFNKAVSLAPENASLRLSLGGFYEQVRMIDRAAAEYRAVMALSPGSEEAINAEKRLNLALVKDYAAKGDLDTAIQLLHSLMEEYPDDPRVLQHLGFAYFLGGRFDDAERAYHRVLEIDPDNDAAHMNIATFFEKTGKPQVAIHHLERVIELAPATARAEQAEVRINLISGINAFRKKELPEALKYLARVLELDPNNLEGNVQIAGVYRELGRLGEAAQALNRALEVEPNNLDARLKLGVVYLEQNNFIDAIWHLEQVLEKGENTPLAQQALGMLRNVAARLGDKLGEVRQLAATKYQFVEQVQRDAGNVQAQFNLGIMHLRQNQLQQAKERFEDVRRLDPGIVRTYLNLGQIYGALGQPKESVEAFSQYIARETEVENLTTVEVPFAIALGQMMFNEEKNQVALHHLERVLERDPQNVVANLYAGLVLARMGHVEEAVARYEKAIEASPEHAGARMNAALLYEQLGREDDALAEYRRVTQLAGATPQMKATAESRIPFLLRVINGLTATAGYSLNIDNNANLSESDPSEEYSSSIFARLDYSYKLRDRTQLKLLYNPMYITYHVGQFDYFNQTVQPYAEYGDRRSKYVISYNYTELSGVLNEQNLNQTGTLSLRHSRQLNGQHSLELELSSRNFESATNSAFNAVTYSGEVSYTHNLGEGWSYNLGYTFSDNQPESVRNLDAEYASHGVNFQLSKWLSEKVNLSFTSSGRYTAYEKPDIFAREAGFGTVYREVWFASLGASLNYRINDSIRFFSSYSFQYNDANLPVFVREVVTNPATGEVTVIFRPYRPQDIIGVPVQSAALSSYQKSLVTIGIGWTF